MKFSKKTAIWFYEVEDGDMTEKEELVKILTVSAKKKKKTEIGETCQKLIFSLNYGYPWLNYLDIKLNQVIPVSKEAG